MFFIETARRLSLQLHQHVRFSVICKHVLVYRMKEGNMKT
jgi:hypothetical protein